MPNGWVPGADYVRHSVGTVLMAKALGFNDLEYRGFTAVEAPVSWAEESPEVWGNRRGLWMFSRDDAFMDGYGPLGHLGLEEVAQHWHRVGERLAGRERG